MLRPASRYARQCSSMIHCRPQRGLKRSSHIRALCGVGDAAPTAAAAGSTAPSSSSRRNRGAPHALGFSQRALLSTTSDRGGGEKDEEGNAAGILRDAGKDASEGDAADSKVNMGVSMWRW